MLRKRKSFYDSLSIGSDQEPDRDSLLKQAEAAGWKAAQEAAKRLGTPDAAQIGSSEWTCPACGETLQLEVTKHHGVVYDAKIPPCRCQKEAYENARDGWLKDHWRSTADELWKAVQVPPRHRDASFENFVRRPGTETALRICQEYVKEFKLGEISESLIFMGPFGSGKSHLAVAVARALVDKELVHVTFTSTLELLAEVKASFGNTAKKSLGDDPVTIASEAELLILDDLGQETATDFARETIFSVINERYERMSPTLFTTNQGDAQLEQRLGGALTSRLYEMARPVRLTASDYRRELAKRGNAS